MGFFSKKKWYHYEKELSGASRIERLPLENIELLSDYWKEIYTKISIQDQPVIRYLEGRNVEIDIDGVIWDSSGDFHTDHHEYSEERVCRLRLTRWPTFSEIIYEPRLAARKFLDRLALMKTGIKQEKLEQENILYVCDNRAMNNFYHWMVEALSRIVLAEKLIKDTYILLSENQLKREYVIASLEKFGFSKDRIIGMKKDTRYAIKNLQVVTTSMFATGACSREGALRIQSLLSSPKSNPDKLIYFARKTHLGRGIVNQSEFEIILKKYNIQSVYPEDISFHDLTELLGNTKIMLSIYSASLAHAVFLKRGSHVIEMASVNFLGSIPDYWGDKYPSKIAGDYYYSLSDHCGLHHNLIPCAQENLDGYILASDIIIDIELLEKTIQRILNS